MQAKEKSVRSGYIKHLLQSAPVTFSGSSSVGCGVLPLPMHAQRLSHACLRAGAHAHHSSAAAGCFFNNVALAARAAQRAGAQRVLIVDWDATHGDGTQALFESSPDVVYLSMHRMDE